MLAKGSKSLEKMYKPTLTCGNIHPCDHYWTLDKFIVLQVGGLESISVYSQHMDTY